MATNGCQSWGRSNWPLVWWQPAQITAMVKSVITKLNDSLPHPHTTLNRPGSCAHGGVLN